MKTIFTLLAILFISFASKAQENTPKVAVVVESETVVLINKNLVKVLSTKETKVARLYLDKNYKVKKALAFTTKNNTSKLA